MNNKLIHLVTGGGGFIGSHLIDKLMEKDFDVICLDNFSIGSLVNIQKWINHKNFKILNQDVKDQIDVKADYIWHLACPASPFKYQQDPIGTIKTCYEGTLNILELTKKLNAKLLFASSSEIYGVSNKMPLSEESLGIVNTLGDRSCYAEGKRICETLCNEFIKKYYLDIKIIRIFNTYGPRMAFQDKRVISSFFESVLEKKDLIIYGNGRQTRSFCYIDDLIDIFIKLIYGGNHGPINIGSTEEVKIIELANLIKNKYYPQGKFIFKNPRIDDPIKRRPSLTKVKKLYGWEPTISLMEGLNKTYKYYFAS